MSQESFLTRGEMDEEFVEGQAAGSGKYMLQAFQGDDYINEEGFFDDDDEVHDIFIRSTSQTTIDRTT